jgi:hypothetical protein
MGLLDRVLLWSVWGDRNNNNNKEEEEKEDEEEKAWCELGASPRQEVGSAGC